MKKHYPIWIAMALCGILPAMLKASDREDDVARTQKAADVFKEIMNDHALAEPERR